MRKLRTVCSTRVGTGLLVAWGAASLLCSCGDSPPPSPTVVGDPTGSGGGEAATGGNGADSGGSSSASGGSSSASGGSQPTGGGTATGGTTTSDWSGEQRSGEATYYNNSGTVGCSFQGTNNNMDIAAINQPDWSEGAWCGACADVTGPNGSVTVRIIDLCPECASGDLDLSQQAFAKIAEVSAGRVSITWNFVACAVSGPVAYRFKDGTNEWWAAILVENHALPVVSLEWSTDGNNWQNASTREWNYFVIDSGVGAGPVWVRITAVDGQQLVDQLPTVQEYLVVDGAAQFQ